MPRQSAVVFRLANRQGIAPPDARTTLTSRRKSVASPSVQTLPDQQRSQPMDGQIRSAGPIATRFVTSPTASSVRPVAGCHIRTEMSPHQRLKLPLPDIARRTDGRARARRFHRHRSTCRRDPLTHRASGRVARCNCGMPMRNDSPGPAGTRRGQQETVRVVATMPRHCIIARHGQWVESRDRPVTAPATCPDSARPCVMAHRQQLELMRSPVWGSVAGAAAVSPAAATAASSS